MSLRSGLWSRLARVHRDERGFSLVEVMVAITVIFASLVTLAYAATVGFSYEDLARQKQTATGIADQVMEQVRGLAWDRITIGHLSSDLGVTRPDLVVTKPDTGYLVTGCPGDAAGIYRLFSCAAGSQPGSGEKVVASAVACPTGSPDCVYPLLRHAGQITQNNLVYTWRIYDTNNCPTDTTAGCTASTPYRITVVVTWTGGVASPNKIVQIQSLFWSPSGCRSTTTHPFAAPCQPFFYGAATAHQPSVDLSGTIDQTSFQSGDLFASGIQAGVQQEQLSQAQGSFNQSGVRLVDGSGTQTGGGTRADTSAADTDPGTSTSTYSRVRCGDAGYACPGGSVSSTGGGNSITLTAPTGETAETDSTTTALVTSVCPPPTDPAQTDGKACSGARVQQGGTLSAVLSIDGSVPGLGSGTLGQILAASNSPDKTFVDRNQFPTTGLCSPVTNADGCLEETGTRTIGTVNAVGLPSGLTAPSGWSGSNAWNGYYFSVVGYGDSVSSAVGTNSTSSATGPQVPAATATVTGGTIYCWNGSGGYNSGSPTSSVSCGSLTLSQTVGGHSVTVTISGSINPAVVTSSPSSGSTSVTTATAQVTAPTATIQYLIVVDGNTSVNLTVTVNLKALEASGSYAVAPTKSS